MANPSWSDAYPIGDSSDEEDSVESYDFTGKLEEFKNSKSEILGSYGLDAVLSFIIHAAGIHMLYSPVVQKRYYELKNEKLSNDIRFKSDEGYRDNYHGKFDHSSLIVIQFDRKLI